MKITRTAYSLLLFSIALMLLSGLATLFPVKGLRAQEGEQKVFEADKGRDNIDVSSFPVEIQERYVVFSKKCSKCHTLARPINTNFSFAKWKRYVKRMLNKPDSGISPNTGKKIYQFLKFHQTYKYKLLGIDESMLLQKEAMQSQQSTGQKADRLQDM